MISERSAPGCWSALVAVVCLLPAGARAEAPAENFAGKYHEPRVTVEIKARADGGYGGTIVMGGRQFPLTARAEGDTLRGTFKSGPTDYAFTATRAGGELKFTTGPWTYSLQREAAAAPADDNPFNPARLLPAPAAAPPAATAPAAPPAPAGPPGASDRPSGATAAFTELGSNAAGVTLFAKLPGVKSVEAALRHAAADLAPRFDARPTLAGGFVDARSQTRGGATFTARAKGQEQRGWLFAGVDAGGAVVSAVYCRADAAQADVAALFAALPAQVRMQPHRFPDGSGTVDLPAGWTTDSPSLGGPLLVKGPAGQVIGTNLTILVNTPDGSLMRLARQSYAQAVANRNQMEQMRRATEERTRQIEQQMAASAAQRGLPPPPPMPRFQPQPLPPLPQPPDAERDYPQLIFCRYCATPEEVVTYLDPVLAARSRKNGGPAVTTDRVIESCPVAPIPLIPGAKASLFLLAQTRTDGAGAPATRLRTLRKIDCWPVGNGQDSWTAVYNGMSAPDATFDRDLPVMKEIMDSIKVDPDWFAAKLKSDAEANREMLRQGERFGQMLVENARQFRANQAERFSRFEANMQAQQDARHAHTQDVIEMIRGYRDVYDTQTGKFSTVDINDTGPNGAVGRLNTQLNDPGRFQELRLRDQ